MAQTMPFNVNFSIMDPQRMVQQMFPLFIFRP
jgi:hypothetical protein